MARVVSYIQDMKTRLDSWCHFKIAAFLVKRPDDGGAPKNDWNEEFSLLKKTSLLS